VREQLRSDGFARAVDIFTPDDLERAREVTQRMIDDWYAGRISDPDFWSWDLGDPPKPTLSRLHRFADKSDVAQELTAHRRFQGLLDDVFGTQAVPTQCAVTIKMPGGGHMVPWHRDPIEAPAFAVYNFSLYLDPSTEENGCLYVLPGSHLERGPAAS